jgi:hypothetical protein
VKAKPFGKTVLKDERLEGTRHVQGVGRVQKRKGSRLEKVKNESRGRN